MLLLRGRLRVEGRRLHDADRLDLSDAYARLSGTPIRRHGHNVYFEHFNDNEFRRIKLLEPVLCIKRTFMI